MKKKIRGQVMLLTIFILGGVILGASTIAGYMMISKIRQAGDLAKSAKAIFAADTGIEWELYKYFIDPARSSPSPLSNNSEFVSNNDGIVIKSVGKHIGVFRAFELQLQGATVTLPILPIN